VGFGDERFGELSKTTGKLSFESEGTVDEKEYSSVNRINSAGTIGYSEVEVDGKVDCIFISRTAGGVVLTMPGDQTGPTPLPIEGYAAVSTVMSGSPAAEFYQAHMRALAGEPPVADRPWLEREVPVLPQRALDVTMKIFSIICEQMDKLMAGMGSAMGEMMEGMGKAMGDALKGAAEAAPNPEKVAARPPKVRGRAQKNGAKKPRSSAPKKKAAPARKAKSCQK